jgi:hypothetical protein
MGKSAPAFPLVRAPDLVFILPFRGAFAQLLLANHWANGYIPEILLESCNLNMDLLSTVSDSPLQIAGR